MQHPLLLRSTRILSPLLQSDLVKYRVKPLGAFASQSYLRRDYSTNPAEVKHISTPHAESGRTFTIPSSALRRAQSGEKHSASLFSRSPRFRASLETHSARRPFSTTAVASVWKYLDIFKNDGTAQRPQKTRDLPPLASFLDDGHAPGRILKTTNEPRLRCTEFDEHGNVTLVNGEFKKSELIAKYGLLPRDLRKIDSSLLPHITIRPTAILLNLLHLRVLIKHDRVLVFDAYGSTDSYTQSVFMYDLEGKLRQVENKANGSLPYEFRALEAVLISVTTGLESEFEGVREPVVRVLRELEEDIDRDKLRYLLIYSKKLGTFEQKARLVRDALDELLESDEDLEDMYLSDNAKGISRAEDDHTDIELLLESYHKVTDEIVQAAENLVSNIRNTEEIVKAILDANRNSLMLLELRFSICTLGLGAGTFIAALYGMNLQNFIEESDYGFWGVSVVCSVLSVVVLAWGLRVLRRVQRVSMWGQGARANLSITGRKAQREQRNLLKAAGKGSRSSSSSSGNGSHHGEGVPPSLWSWGLGNGTAEAGMGANAALDAKSDRLRQTNSSSQARELASRRAVRAIPRNSSLGDASNGSSLGRTASGMGAKPTSVLSRSD